MRLGLTNCFVTLDFPIKMKTGESDEMTEQGWTKS
jgi:hypothetical protein